MRPDIKWRISSQGLKKSKSKSFLSFAMIIAAFIFLGSVYLFSLYDQRTTLQKFRETPPVSIALTDFHSPQPLSPVSPPSLPQADVISKDQNLIQKILQDFKVPSSTFILAQIAAQDQHQEPDKIFYTSALQFHTFLSQAFPKINEKTDPTAATSQSSNIITPTNLPIDAPFHRYAQSFENPEKLSLITFVFLKLGEDASLTQKAMNLLPKEITFAYLPYGSQIADSIQTASQAGREVLMMIPMEPLDYPDSDPGTNTLLTGLDPSQTQKRLECHLNQGKEIIGVTNFLGSRFAFSAPDLKVLLESLKTKGLMILDANTSPRSLISETAQEMQLPCAQTTFQIDTDLSSEDIKSKLFMLEQRALKEGKAIGYAFVNDLTLETVAAWSKTLSQRGIALAPLTYFVGNNK